MKDWRKGTIVRRKKRIWRIDKQKLKAKSQSMWVGEMRKAQETLEEKGRQNAEHK